MRQQNGQAIRSPIAFSCATLQDPICASDSSVSLGPLRNVLVFHENIR